MLAETLIGTGAFATGGFVYAKSRRARLYRELADRIAQISRAREPDWAAVGSRRMPDFADHLAVVPDFLPAPEFAALAAEAERLAAPERSFVPVHKQGGTVAYETLIAAAPRDRGRLSLGRFARGPLASGRHPDSADPDQ